MNAPVRAIAIFPQPGLVFALLLCVGVFVGGCDHEHTLPTEGEAREQAGTTSVLPFGPDSVTIDAMRPFEPAPGYTYAEATMHGTGYRQAEQELWAYAGLTPTEHRIRLASIELEIRVQKEGDGHWPWFNDLDDDAGVIRRFLDPDTRSLSSA
jgi:hypothetical protein